MPTNPASQPPAFTFAEVDAASRRLTGADLPHILTGLVAAAIPLIELRPVLRCVAWLAGA